MLSAGDSIAEVAWNWGDGSIIYLPSLTASWFQYPYFPQTHKYNQNGTFTVQVMATSQAGEITATSTSVAISGVTGTACPTIYTIPNTSLQVAIENTTDPQYALTGDEIQALLVALSRYPQSQLKPVKHLVIIPNPDNQDGWSSNGSLSDGFYLVVPAIRYRPQPPYYTRDGSWDDVMATLLGNYGLTSEQAAESAALTLALNPNDVFGRWYHEWTFDTTKFLTNMTSHSSFSQDPVDLISALFVAGFFVDASAQKIATYVRTSTPPVWLDYSLTKDSLSFGSFKAFLNDGNITGFQYIANGHTTTGTFQTPVRLPSTILPLPPVITSPLTMQGTVGAPFTYTVAVSNSPTSITVTDLPRGLSFDPAKRQITGIPLAPGNSLVTITATNAAGTATAALRLFITLPAMPAITSSLSAKATVGAAFSYQITATNNPTSFGATGLPQGLALNTTTGLITGIPQAAGNSNITLSATNAAGTTTAVLNLTVNPGAPVVSSVVNAASLNPGVSAGSLVTIKGSNLANTTRSWNSSDFVNDALPTKLDGVSVTANNKPAYVSYISPGQINAQAPSDTAIGTVNVEVTNNGANSSLAPAQLQAAAPAFFQWGNYAVATRPDYSLVGPASLFQGVSSAPAKPGDVIILWGTGFGPTNPVVPAGVVPPSDTLANVSNPVTVLIGNVQARVIGAAISPGSAGVYQIAVQVPNTIADGDQPIVAKVLGFASPSSVLLSVQR
ncbi:MAG: putative Ig domain-containing protein [Acidobacteriia bacterium]|nr:putative Ig domain-containing protein [Terriglobia bacterium]